jgi:hypothetical protein
MANHKKNIIFLDFDGVIRVQMKEGHQIDKFEFCPDRVNTLAAICKMFDAKIVLSTDWRQHPKVFDFIPRLIPYIHEDSKTLVKGHRWEEVFDWLSSHPDTDNYAILEDLDVHFEDAPQMMKDRIVWCDSVTGIDKEGFAKLTDLLI